MVLLFFVVAVIDIFLVNDFSESEFSTTVQIESGLGGAGTSGIGKGITVVIPRKGVGGGVIYTFLGGKGGVIDTWRSREIWSYCSLSSCWTCIDSFCSREFSKVLFFFTFDSFKGALSSKSQNS